MTSKCKLLAKTFALVTIISLSACSNQHSNTEDAKQPNIEDLAIISQEKFGNRTFSVLYDPNSMELYTFLKYDGNDEGHLASMYNADGTPMLFSLEE